MYTIFTAGPKTMSRAIVIVLSVCLVVAEVPKIALWYDAVIRGKSKVQTQSTLTYDLQRVPTHHMFWIAHMLSALVVSFMTFYRVWYNSLIAQKLFEVCNMIFVLTVVLQMDKLGVASPKMAMCINLALLSALILTVDKPRLYLAILSIPIWLSTIPILGIVGLWFAGTYMMIMGSFGVLGFLATIIILTGFRVSCG